METQVTVARWAESVFGPVNGVRSPMLRVVNEVAEALIATGIDEADAVARLRAEYARQRAKGVGEDPANLPSEMAGIVIVLFRAAAAAGVDLQAAIDAEMAKNRARDAFARGDGTGMRPAAGRDE